MASKKSKHQPPSRRKYNQNHPTVSARLPTEERSKLIAVLRSLGLSLPQLLSNFANEFETKVKPLEEARKEGYEEAQKKYMVTFPCSVCGKPTPITGPQAKVAAGKYMTEGHWGHAECHRKSQQSK